MYLAPVDARSTRVREVSLGTGRGRGVAQQMRQFFDRGNALTLRSLQKRFAPAPSQR